MSQISGTGLQQLGSSVSAVKDFLSKSYMQSFVSPGCQVLGISDPVRVKRGIRLLRIQQIAISDEEVTSRLTTVYQTMNALVNSCFMMIQGTVDGISLYIGFQSDAPGTAEKALIQTLTGNFPGMVMESLNATKIDEIMGRMSSNPNHELKTVGAVSVVPSSRKERFSGADVQGMEKFMDTMQGKEFTALIIATPYSKDVIDRRILSLEAISTALSPLEQISVHDTQSQSTALTDTTAQTLSQTISNSISEAYSVTNSNGVFSSSGNGNAFTITPLGLGISFQKQQANGMQAGRSVGINYGRQSGSAIGKADMTSTALQKSTGSSRTIVRTETNKEIRDLRVKLDKQISRLRESESQGLWDCCGYFISNANDTTIVATNSFRSIVTGDNTDVEQSVIDLWQPTRPGDLNSNHQNIQNLTDTLSMGVAPVFYVGNAPQRMESIVTGKELSRMMNLPRKSAGMVSVMHMATFGRNIHLIGGKDRKVFEQSSFPVGNLMHMGRIDGHTRTRLELQKLNAHTLAVGATGVGKTTTIGDILYQLHGNNIPFTVIEPAKGEYGKLWGKLPGIDIYSTTPFRYRMLKVNPFAFEKNVHILNHMERLISVFSTAWPLYAAQPAVLRDCVRMAYIHCGWDLTNSICLKGKRVFPTFVDVLAELPKAIEKSRFVGEAKGTYEGALQTRLSMLTEGIFKEIFCSGYDIPDCDLFDKNVIIDLSRLGSQETLSLIMGVLLIRLYEHRINEGKKNRLCHVTVLEEAHNILKKSSSVPQGEDSPSIGSKSVEVLTKCITELRFTGEGFIIADQSPGELDPTAMKNTSTKIVMRLQDATDQTAVESALSLDREQVLELSKLDNGVGVVFQEGWIEPVLTKFDFYKNPYAVAPTDLSFQPEVEYADLCKVRGFLLGEIVGQFNRNVYDKNELIRKLHCIRDFSKWKIEDYIALFERSQIEYESIRLFWDSNRVKYPYYGKIIRELINGVNFFEVIPLPKVDPKTMQKPYSKDRQYRAKCERWKDDAMIAMDQYAYPLTDAEKETILRLLLLADGEKKSDQITVCASCFMK